MTNYSQFSDIVNTTTYCLQYAAVNAAMVVKPSNTDATNQNTLLKGLVDNGTYAKAELIDIFSVHGNAESLFNWKNPANFNPSLVGVPAWEQYKGFTGNGGTAYIMMNFNPALNLSIINQDNICVMWGIGNNVAENLNDIAWNTSGNQIRVRSRDTTNYLRTLLNDATLSIRTNQLSSINHYAMSRNIAGSYETYVNDVKATVAIASTGLPNTLGYAIGGTKQIRYIILSSYLTEAEIAANRILIEAYLDNYGAGLL